MFSIFDFNNDGKLDDFEQAAEAIFIEKLSEDNDGDDEAEDDDDDDESDG